METEEHSHAVPRRLIARVNKSRLYLMLSAALVGYVAFYFFVDRVEMIILGFCVVIAVGYGIREIVRNDTRIEIDERGVHDSRLGLGTIRWRDITSVYITRYQNIEHVCMDVVDPDKYLRRRRALTRGFLTFHQKMNKISPFNINAGVLDANAGEIYDVLVENWEFYREDNVPEVSRDR